MADVQTKPFPNYQELPARLPNMIWWALRLFVAAATIFVMYLVVTDPEQGMTIFWRLLVPTLPLLFAAAPGIWRQVCPMALVNQLPRTFGISRERRLPPWLKNVAFLIATVSFFLLVSLRHLFFNVDSASLIVLMVGALTLAFGGGLVFAGRSGWCGTFCPLAPIQKAYGHAPLLVERNGYCPTCLGCQKNCYDFNPKAAFLTDLNDKDPWYAGHKRFFVAALPGFAIAFFTAPDPHEVGLFAYYSYLFIWMVGTMGFFFLCRSLIRLSNFRASAIAAMSALVIFYYFTAEGIVATLAALLGAAPPAFGPAIIQIVALIVAASVLWKGFQAERAFDALNAEASAGRTSVDVGKANAAARTSEGLVTEKTSGRSFAADPTKSLLEGIEAAGLSIDFGCRMGMCGADPVVVAEGGEHLDPPNDTELATLRRLGLEGRARLACVCRAAKGPVVIDLETDPASLPEPEPTLDAVDHAAVTGIQKIVVIGNGAAGSTVANELRRLGPSATIDLVAQENHPFYNRMAIGRLLYETQGIEDLYFVSQAAMAKKNINVRLNTLARSINREAQTVALGTGEILAYDRLFLANGAQAFAPPIPGMDKSGAFVLREASDAQAIRAWRQSEDCQNAMVLGGGVLGVEAADALRKLRLKTTIVQRSARLMDRELDEKGSRILQTFLTRIGIDVITGASAEELIGEDRVREVRLTNGSQQPCDLFIACAGVRPNVELAREAGLKVDRGVLVDEHMRTSDPNIFAIGDVAERPRQIGGLWTVGTSQAEIASSAVFGIVRTAHPPAPLVSLKMEGIDVKGFGIKEAGEGVEEIYDPDEPENIHRRLFITGGKIVGAVFVGPPGTGKDVGLAIQAGTSVEPILDRLRKFDWAALSEL
ncbi:FAD-dependent oxidoreductase [uncultured Maritimibacter sp.]|uniref:FAD-dependent oxidoreductase n=1 Tax=uncultured Maritimibacter sp. TaxID=991866 RepID=UPI000C099183|nr:hypothetical protein [Maritimibacter sp.]|tara:strand:+ start:43776 stop:46415 length:2640 start_codon:yes stop_codon:yes gene_type:complete